MTESEALELRQRLIHDVYSELAEYLEEDMAATLAANLQTTVELVHEAYHQDWHLPLLRKVCCGELENSDGKPYSPALIDELFYVLGELNENPRWEEPIAQRNPHELRKLFWTPVVATTGRVRAGVPFCSAKNTPFQAAAADGARCALWRLYREGYELAAFVHDEFLIAVSADDDHTDIARRMEQICIDQMQPFCGDIPVTCKYALTRRWSKDAEAVFDNDGRLLPWEPNAKPDGSE